MKAEHILARAPKVLSQAEREAYFEDGYLLLEGFVDSAWHERHRTIFAAQQRER